MVKVMLDFAVSHPQRDMIEGSIQRFYGQERDVLVKCIRAGIKAGHFRKLDPSKAAQVASTMLDGVIVRCQIQEDFDLRAAVADLKTVYWSYLGYTGNSVPRPKTSSRQASRFRSGVSKP